MGYHKNGQLAWKGNYKKGKSEGQWLWYTENGQLEIKGNYEDDKKEGEWFTYYKDGPLNHIMTYKNGELIETIKH